MSGGLSRRKDYMEREDFIGKTLREDFKGRLFSPFTNMSNETLLICKVKPY